MNNTKMIVLILVNMIFSVQAENNEAIQIEVYRSPSCGCCSKWISHLKKNNFIVKDNVTDNVQPIKDRFSVPSELSSCHTALVNGYVVEGHVPASDIKQLLNIKSAVIGVSVPAMPVGTPGMEMGDRKDPYQVVAFDKDKKYQVVNSYEGN